MKYSSADFYTDMCSVIFTPYMYVDETVNNQFVAMEVLCLCVFSTDMGNYIQGFLYKFGVNNFKIS